MRSVLCALFVVCAAPSFAHAQRVAPRYEEPRWERPPPWAFGEDLADSADALAARAARIHRELRSVDGRSELATRAQRFARTTSRFARDVESGRGAPATRFEDLQREYQDLRAALFEAHRTRALEDVTESWAALAASFERVALELGVEETQLCALEPDPYDRGAAYDYDYRYDERYGRYDPRLDRVP